MRHSTVNHNGGTKSIAKALWQAEQKANERAAAAVKAAAALREEFRANQNRLAMELVHQAAA